jgi:hypothetical protein
MDNGTVSDSRHIRIQISASGRWRCVELSGKVDDLLFGPPFVKLGNIITQFLVDDVDDELVLTPA